MNTQPITLQLSPELLAQAQKIIGNTEDLHSFLVRAIDRVIQRSQPPAQQTKFWENVEELRAKMQAEGIEIDSDEVWGDVRERSPLARSFYEPILEKTGSPPDAMQAG